VIEMKCPQCGNPKVAYKVSHSKRSRETRIAGKQNEARTDFTVECDKCGFKGEIR